MKEVLQPALPLRAPGKFEIEPALAANYREKLGSPNASSQSSKPKSSEVEPQPKSSATTTKQNGEPSKPPPAVTATDLDAKKPELKKKEQTQAESFQVKTEARPTPEKANAKNNESNMGQSYATVVNLAKNIPSSFWPMKKDEGKPTDKKPIDTHTAQKTAKANASNKLPDNLALLMIDKEMVEDELRKTQSELRKTQAELQRVALTRQHDQELRSQTIRRNDDFDHAVNEYHRMKKDLEACNEQILRMQPFKQVSEIDIKIMYTNLCSAIETWCENHFGDLQDLQKSLKAIQWDDDQRGILHEFMAHGEAELVKARPETSVHMTMYMAMINLFLHLFKRGQWVFGMANDEKQLLNEVLEAMEGLEPKRDINAISLWRGETYQALMNIPKYANMHDRYLFGTTEAVRSIYLSLAGPVVEEAFDGKGLHQITLEAAKLAVSTASSSELYSLEYRFNPRDAPAERVLTHCEMHKYHMIDVATGQPVTTSFEIASGKGGRVGEMLVVLFPALERYQGDETVKLIEKATILVEFDMPVKRKGKGKGKAK